MSSNKLTLEEAKQLILNGNLVSNLPESFRNHKTIIRLAVQDGLNYVNAVMNMSDTLKNDQDFLFKLVKVNMRVFKYLSNACDNYHIINYLISNGYGCYMQYASKRLLADETLVSRAISCNKYRRNKLNIHYVDDSVFTKKFIEKHIQHSSELFCYLDEELQNNKQYVLNLLKKNGSIYEYLIEHLREDKEIMKQTLSVNGYILTWMPTEITDNDDMCHLALSNMMGYAYLFLSKRLKADFTFIVQAFSHKNKKHDGLKEQNMPAHIQNFVECQKYLYPCYTTYDICFIELDFQIRTRMFKFLKGTSKDIYFKYL